MAEVQVRTRKRARPAAWLLHLVRRVELHEVLPRKRARPAAWLLLLAATLPACRPPAAEEPPAREPSQVGAEPAPATAEAFLRQLLPSIGRDLHVAYDLIGPRGYTGTMDVFVRPGGFTVQQWHLSHPDGDAIEGAWAQTPDVQWSRGTGQPATVVERPLGAMARAFAQLPVDTQRRITATIRTWHDVVAEDRDRQPGPSEHHLGRRCRAAEVVGQRYCVWEEAGVVLSFRSETLRLQARSIATDMAIEASRFDVPEGATRPTDPPSSLDTTDALAGLAAGDSAVVARLLRPALPLALAGP